MLPRAHRLASGDEIRTVVRRGRRTTSPSVVLYRLPAGSDAPPRLAVIVSKQVGGAVVRNRVRRRLQAACATQLESFPAETSSCFALSGVIKGELGYLRNEIGDGVRRAVRVS